MRAWMFFIVLAACSPDIPSGSYECGPNSTCPENQACDGPTNTCVIASTATAFSCPTDSDNTPATGTAIPPLECVSSVFEHADCLAANDGQDYFHLTAPTGCTAVEIKVIVAYPVAFEPLALELTDTSTGSQVATDTACKNPPPGGEESRCITQTITPGNPYALAVKPLGKGDDCDGACNFNRYTLSVQLDTP